MLDISVAGASVRLEEPLGDVPETRLIIDAAPPILAAVAWRRQATLGLRFLEEQQWVLELHSRRFDPAAWLRGR